MLTHKLIRGRSWLAFLLAIGATIIAFTGMTLARVGRIGKLEGFGYLYQSARLRPRRGHFANSAAQRRRRRERMRRPNHGRQVRILSNAPLISLDRSSFGAKTSHDLK